MKNKITADFVVGGVAQNDDYYFHKTFLDDLWDSLKKDNVLLLSPRRTGKTSVMYRLLEQPRNGFRVIHLNVEALETPAEFYLSLVDAINEHQPEYMNKLSSSWDLFKDIGKRVEEIGFMDFKIKLRKATDWDLRWKELSQQLLDKVITVDEPVLFIIDELPDMLSSMSGESPDQLKDFLHHFRKTRIDPKNEEKIHWLVGGSVNIRGTLDEFGMIQLINDLKTETLPPIKKQEVDSFVQVMLSERDVRYDESLIPRVHQLLGEPIPFFLQLFTQELYRYWRREKPDSLNASHAEQIFKHALLGEAAHDKLQHYYSRIQLYYPQDDHEITYVLLGALSQSDQGISEKGLFSLYQKKQLEQSKQMNTQAMHHAFKRLLLRLESDFYISNRNDNRYDFNSFLLKTWWRKNWAYINE